MAELVIPPIVSAVVSPVIPFVISSVTSAITNVNALTSNKIEDPEIRKKVEIVRFNLAAIEIKLKDVENEPSRNRSEANLVCEIERVAHLLQDVAEELLWLQQQQNEARGIIGSVARYLNTHKNAKTLRKIGQDIDVIQSLIAQMPVTITTLNTLLPENANSMVGQSGTQWSLDPRNETPGDVVVGLDSQMDDIVMKLLDEKHGQLSIVSIVGMGGIGKSTLAWKVRNHPKINKHFHKMIIWIPISQQCSVRTIQEKILKGATQFETEDLEKMTDEKVKEEIIKSLRHKRYLIVMDGTWTTWLWDEISFIFHILNNGSRIIQTTRKLDVAKYPKGRVKNYIHEVKLLNDEASWELFNKKAMVREEKRKQLENLNKQLAGKCDGLPLALIVLGNYLSNVDDHGEWSRINKNGIDWNKISVNGISILKILGLSYDELPSNLKKIFLYITSFPKGQIIRVSEITKLLIAEEFVPFGGISPPEDVAWDCVDELHKRCLVQVVKRSRDHERITEIRIHDVLCDWGIKRAQEERFLNVINSRDHAEVLSYRVAFHGYYADKLANTKADLHTLLGFNLPEKQVNLSDFQSSRVLRFNPSRALSDNLPQFIKHMIFLRCICLRNCGKINLPSSIGQLFKLQTLDCRESTMVNALPDSLWKISTLRHVYLKDVCGNWEGPRKGLCTSLRSLYIYDRVKKSTLKSYMPLMYTGLDRIAEAVKKMTDIVALGLISYAGLLPQNILNNISGLSSLEVLELSEKEVPVLNRETGLSRIPRDYRFPENLTKIKLGCPNLKEDPMPFLEKHPRLVVLELSNVITLNRFKKNSSSDSNFPFLKYLTIINFLGEELKADDRAMPNLCHLKLGGCTNLVRIPTAFQRREVFVIEIISGPYAPFGIDMISP